MPQKGNTIFTIHAVQRAMDTQARKWGPYPPGYFAVGERLRRLSFDEITYEVTVRLFGGRVRHVEAVVFIREGYKPNGKITFASLVEHYNGPNAHKLWRKDGKPKAAKKGRKVPDCGTLLEDHKAMEQARRAAGLPRKGGRVSRFEGLTMSEKQAACRREHQEKSAKTALMTRTQWTQSEDRTLREDTINKVPLDQTAAKLGRTYFATSQRRIVLGISIKRNRKET